MASRPLASLIPVAFFLGVGFACVPSALAQAEAKAPTEKTEKSAPSPAETKESSPGETEKVSPAPTKAKLEKATFGGGCFWCLEAVFERLKGVKSVVSGYAGGNVAKPSYALVSTG